MQGRNASLIVATAAALGWTLAGCTAKKDPPQPASPSQQLQAPPASPAAAPQSAAPAAPAASAAKPAPAAPATKPAAAAAPKPAPSPTQEPAAAAGAKTYTIKPGDNLWKISKEVYGDATKYTRIIEANPGLNPDNMKVGTKIVIP